MSDLVFLDTETTGLRPDDDIWELAAVRRTGDAEDRVLHIQVSHDTVKAARLPAEFAADRRERFDRDSALRQTVAGARVHAFMAPGPDGTKPTMVGVNPAFDAMMVSRLLRRSGFTADPPWDYRLIDLPAVAVGVLAARGQCPTFPARSDDLAAATGAPPAPDTRHTAMGDVRWAIDWWTALTRDTQPTPPTPSVDDALATLRTFAAAAADEGVNIGTPSQLYRRALTGVLATDGVQPLLQVEAAANVLKAAGAL